MTYSLFLLAAGFAGLAALLVAALIYSRWPAWSKAVLVVLVSGFYYANYTALQGTVGWPTSEPIPEHFMLLGSSVREPDRASGDPGIIHLWVNSLAGAQPAHWPRAYELPYSRDLHYQLQEARKRQDEGIPQIGRRVYEPANAETPRERGSFARAKTTVKIEDLPDPVLPEK